MALKKATRATGGTAKKTVAKGSTAKKAAPKKAGTKKAPPKKAAGPKLSPAQTELLEKVAGVGEAGYLAEKKPENKSLESLLKHKLVKRGKKHPTTKNYHYSISKAGEKHLASSPAPAPPTRSTLGSCTSTRSGSAHRLRVGAVSAFHPGEEASWEELNQRRHNLIDKDMQEGLTPGEEAELRVLEEKAEGYLDLVAAEPFDIFERLKQCAARDGLTVNLDGDQ
jgi:hypothetical protein